VHDYRTAYHISNPRIAYKIDRYNEINNLLQHTNFPSRITLLKMLLQRIKTLHLNSVAIKSHPTEMTDNKIIDETIIVQRQDNEIIHHNIQVEITTQDRNIIIIEVMTSDNKVTIVKADIRKNITEEDHHVEVCNHTEGHLVTTEEAT